MNKSQHSPAPWTWAEVHPAEDEDSWPTWVRLDAADNQVVFVQDGPVKISPADARLLAAAPELLAVAEDLYAAVVAWIEDECSKPAVAIEEDETLAKARALFARIEGTAP